MKLKVESVLAALAAGLIGAGSALAAPPGPSIDHMTLGYTYYNRAGANLKAHDRDVGECAYEADKIRVFNERTGWGHAGPPTSLIAAGGNMIGAAVTNASHRGAAAASLENCMVVRGWRVVHLPDAEGLALAALSPSDLAARLAPWVGADNPHGEVVRVWHNDAARASNTRNAAMPAHTNDGQLSLKAATAVDLTAAFPPPLGDAPRLARTDPKWPWAPLGPARLATVPAEGGVILVRLKGAGLHNGNELILNRVGTRADVRPSSLDHAPDVVTVSANIYRGDGAVYAYAAPAGRWRISSIGALPAWRINFCLGSPSFELKAGEVVFAGTFEMGSEDLGPDLSLDPVKTWLAGQPAAAMVRAADYTNGSVGSCGDDLLYALEIKGAPFEPGYMWGSQAKAIEH